MKEEDLFNFHNAQKELSMALASKFPEAKKQLYYQKIEDSSDTYDQEASLSHKKKIIFSIFMFIIQPYSFEGWS